MRALASKLQDEEVESSKSFQNPGTIESYGTILMQRPFSLQTRNNSDEVFHES